MASFALNVVFRCVAALYKIIPFTPAFAILRTVRRSPSYFLSLGLCFFSALLLLDWAFFGVMAQSANQKTSSAQKEEKSLNHSLPNTDERIRIADIDGGTRVKVQRGKPQLQLKRGAVLRPGDVVITGEGQTVKIRLAYGMVMAVAENSRFKVVLSQNAERATQLLKGRYRGRVDKQEGLIRKKKGKRHRLLIRTRTAVMGVRGTDFVTSVAEKSGATDFHTLEGVVDVAKNEQNLVKGQATEVAAGNAVSTTPKQISAPSTFNVKQFAGSLGKLSGAVGDDPDIFKETPDPLIPAPSPSVSPSVLPETDPSPEVSPSASPAPEEKKKKEDKTNKKSSLHLWDFEVAGHVLHTRLDNDTSLTSISFIDNQLGVGVAWTPRLDIIGSFLGIRASVAPIWYKDTLEFKTSRLFTVEGRLLMEFKLLGLVVSGGPMVRKWTAEKTRAGLQANVSIKFGLFFFDRIFIGAGRSLGPEIEGKQFLIGHAGLGLRF